MAIGVVIGWLNIVRINNNSFCNPKTQPFARVG